MEDSIKTFLVIALVFFTLMFVTITANAQWMVTTTIKNKHSGVIYKTEEDWKAQGIPESDIRRDVHVLMPNLDLFSKTK